MSTPPGGATTGGAAALIDALGEKLGRTASSVFRSAVRAVGNRRGRDSELWASLLIVFGGLRLIRRLAKRRRDVVFSEKLKPGETLQIRHLASGQLTAAAVRAGSSEGGEPTA